tara:strand:- start:112 stop:483 length:372 start_codon:yes stop_codon:yes gene_type:complete
MADSNKKETEIPIHIKKNLIQVVIRQTDYSEKDAEEKLIKFNYDVLDVVRDYMKPHNVKIESNINNKVTNVHQQKFTEIRKLMDDASNSYRKKKEDELKRAELLNYYRQQREKASNKLNKNIK